MSPTDGLDFELRVFRVVQRLLFGSPAANENRWDVYHRRSYHSKDRRARITIDVAAEYVLAGAADCSIVWAWECKDYRTTAVPVSDVEEFHSKLQQIGESNTKGTLVSSGPLQRAALQYAMSKRIAIARLFPADAVQWISYAADPSVDPLAGLCDLDFVPRNLELVAVTTSTSFVIGTVEDYIRADGA